MPAESYHDFPLSENWRWDSRSAEDGLRRWASTDGSGSKETMDWDRLRQVYFWHESGVLENFGQLKFPYCRIESGEPHVVHNACQNALARIGGSDIPAEDMPRVRSVAQRQMDRFQGNDDEESARFAARPSSKPTSKQMTLINRFAKEPLTEDEVYVHGFRLIGTRLIPDRYLTIDRSLLDIYLRDLKNGDVVQIADHSMGGFKGLLQITVPFGRFFDGQITEEDGEAHLDGWMYMRAGQKTYVEPFTTDDIDAQLNAGILHDSSVGIAWDRSECSICGNDIRDFQNCPHIPGQTYAVRGADTLCTVIAKPSEQNSKAYMAENSLVGIGAYPDAGHLAKDIGPPEKDRYRQVHDMMELKLLPQEEVVFCLFSSDSVEVVTHADAEAEAVREHELYHMLYRCGLPVGWSMDHLSKKHAEVVARLAQQPTLRTQGDLDQCLHGIMHDRSGKEMKRVEMEQLLTELLARFHVDPNDIDALTETGFAMKDGSEVSVFHVQDQQAEQKIADLEAKLAKMEPLAKDGEAFRKEVIEDALAAGVRAQGNDFPVDTWKNTFASMEISAIRDISRTFRKQAEAEIPAGRMTVPENRSKTVAKNIPDDAYKA